MVNKNTLGVKVAWLRKTVIKWSDIYESVAKINIAPEMKRYSQSEGVLYRGVETTRAREHRPLNVLTGRALPL